MGTLVDQVLLAVAVAALGASALRAASLASARGLERLVAAAPLGAAAGVGEAMLLGRVGLAGSAPALAAGAALTWLAAQRLPAPAVTVREELRTLGARRATAAALACGAAVAVAAWAALRPFLGLDGLTYHLGKVVIWVQHGRTGSVEQLIVDFPVGNYPSTNEAALAWAVGLSHSLVPLALWLVAMLALFLAAAWLGMRRLGVPTVVAALAVAAFLSTPLLLRQVVQAETDFPALAWLATTAALCAAAPRRPGLLAPALLAAALAVGTKTTALPLAAAALAIAGFALRDQLRPLARPLIFAAGAGVLVGGVWYVRNLVQHGSPLWPLIAAPWGDPVPPKLERVDQSFLGAPRRTLGSEGAASFYRNQLAGLMVVFAAGLLAPIWARRREVAAAAVAAFGAALIWASGPFTGASGDPNFTALPLNTLRYTGPALAAGTLAVALAARRSRGLTRVAVGVLVAAIAWNAGRYWQDPYLPAEELLLAALAVAVPVAALVARVARGPAWAWSVAALAAATLGLTAAAHGYLNRHINSNEYDAGLLGWLEDRPSWRDGERPIAFSPTVIATAAGDRLQHPLSLAGPRESCERIRRRVGEGWLVVEPARRDLFPARSLTSCLRGVEPRLDTGTQRVFTGLP